MDYSYYLKKGRPDAKKLTDHGFSLDGEAFVLKRDLKQNGLYAVIKISADAIDVRVIDRAFDDDFIPFGIKDSKCPEKHEVGRMLDAIVGECFVRTDIKDELIRYLSEKYGTTPEHPWEAYPDYSTFKTAFGKKWYALIMNIKQSRIGLDGDNVVDVMNIKVEPEKIPLLIDNARYFPAYHMCKKSWITILLDRNTNIDEVKELIAGSYSLAECKRGGHNG